MSSPRPILRRLARTPLFTTVALLTLAIGIGANSAIFSVVEAVLIKPLNFPHSEALVAIWHNAPGIQGIGDNINCDPAMSFTYREENRTFQDFGLWNLSGASVTGIAEPEAVQTLNVTYGTLPALGVQPVVGRWFSQADDSPGTPQTVILSYNYWQKRFGGDKNVAGRTIDVDSQPRTIIGAMPQSFRFQNQNPDLILPQRFERGKMFLGNFSYQGVARLKPGVTIEQANADVTRMLGIWLREWPPFPGTTRELFESAHFSARLQPLKTEVVGDIGPTLWILAGTIGLVLLIACANIANLLLVRAEGRQQELAIRAALGAGWGRIAQDMLLESLILGLAGGALGLGLAYAGLKLLVAKGPANLPRLAEIGIDPYVLAFTFAVSLFAGLLFGLVPVLKYAGPHVAAALRGSGRSMTQSRERHRARNTLVIVQVCLALVLLVGSGLMIRTFQAIRSVQPGFADPEHVQVLHIVLPESQVPNDRVTRLQNDMLDKLAALPGVSAASFGSDAPMEGYNSNDILYAQDRTYAANQIPPIRRFRMVAPGYFHALGTPLMAGRDFTWTDLYEKRHVAMVSANLARELWGSPNAAIGKHIRSLSNDPWREVIGVVGDVYDNGAQVSAPSMAYWPVLMDRFEVDGISATRFIAFVLRTDRAGTEALLSEARKAIWSLDANLPVFLTSRLEDIYAGSMVRTSFTLAMLAIAGAMALLLGLIGIYGVIAYGVSQRRREIGIRMALGARPADLHGMFLRQGLRLAAIGTALGLAAAAALTRLMSSLLFGTRPLDPLTYGLAALVLIAAAALASYLPARRATDVDPLESLRAE